jgi:hypothetical protein
VLFSTRYFKLILKNHLKSNWKWLQTKYKNYDCKKQDLNWKDLWQLWFDISHTWPSFITRKARWPSAYKIYPPINFMYIDEMTILGKSKFPMINIAIIITITNQIRFLLWSDFLAHLAKGNLNRPIRNKNCLWRPLFVNGSGQNEQSL